MVACQLPGEIVDKTVICPAFDTVPVLAHCLAHRPDTVLVVCVADDNQSWYLDDVRASQFLLAMHSREAFLTLTNVTVGKIQAAAAVLAGRGSTLVHVGFTRFSDVAIYTFAFKVGIIIDIDTLHVLVLDTGFFEARWDVFLFAILAFETFWTTAHVVVLQIEALSTVLTRFRFAFIDVGFTQAPFKPILAHAHEVVDEVQTRAFVLTQTEDAVVDVRLTEETFVPGFTQTNVIFAWQQSRHAHCFVLAFVLATRVFGSRWSHRDTSESINRIFPNRVTANWTCHAFIFTK